MCVCVYVCMCMCVVCRLPPQLSAAAGVSCVLYSFGACTTSQGLLTLLHQGVLLCLSVCVSSPKLHITKRSGEDTTVAAC